jgi:hypothetical protein
MPQDSNNLLSDIDLQDLVASAISCYQERSLLEDKFEKYKEMLRYVTDGQKQSFEFKEMGKIHVSAKKTSKVVSIAD